MKMIAGMKKCVVVSEEYLDALRAVKRAFDPNLILNPGKIFDP